MSKRSPCPNSSRSSSPTFPNRVWRASASRSRSCTPDSCATTAVVRRRHLMRVAVLVLAAGRSTRFGAGGHKLLAPIDGAPLVRRSVAAAVDAAIGNVVVVTGAEALRVDQAIAGLDVHVVHEPAFADGLATSLRRGLDAVPSDATAVVIGLGDQPFVRPDAYRRVVSTWMSTGAAIVVPRYSDTDAVSHPVLFAR